VRVRIGSTDLLTLDVQASVVARLDDPTTTADDAVVGDAELDEAAEAAGPLTLAIDVQADGPEGQSSATAEIAPTA
jgi:exoribonuclease II